MPEYIKFEPLRGDILNDTEYDSDTVNHFLNIVDSQPAADVAEVKKFADELCSKFAGHSDYHGDTILSTIRCIAEGKKVGNARPLKYKKYDNHGQWTEKRARFGATLPIYACSVCGRAFTFRPGYDFCPGCGADMREGAENGRS